MIYIVTKVDTAYHLKSNVYTVSPRINVHVLINENRLFYAWLRKYIFSFISTCTYIFEYYVHALIFENYYAYHCATQDI